MQTISPWKWRGAVLLNLAGLGLLFSPALCRAQSPSGYIISTVAGTGTRGYAGDGGPATGARLAGPYGLGLDAARNLFLSDQLNNRIRQLSASGTISTVAGTGDNGYAGDDGRATSAQISNPLGVAVDRSGNFYIAQTGSNVVRKVTSSVTISTFAGKATAGNGYAGDGGPARPGETIIIVGVGFGPVTPDIPAGQVTQQTPCKQI